VLRGPPGHVLAAWQLRDTAPVPGAEGRAWAGGDLVLKRAEDSPRTRWLAGVLDRVDGAPHGVRVVRPAPARDGRWVVDGWAAWHRLDGEHRWGVWEAVLDASTRFHRATADVPWSPRLAASHRWAVADRAAWGEAPSPADAPALVRHLVARRRPVGLSSQLVHGDLTGNVLLHDALPPAVIDVSPYWRPAGFADAVVVADALAWHGAPERLAEELLRRQGDQLLLRAVLFRVLADPPHARAYDAVTRLLLA
jgi:uncharacterized protein (TIGR02569 family)